MEDALGRLSRVDVHTAWKHEAHDFTQWLLGAADVLGGALGEDLELTEAEHRVGGFSLDLIGRDTETGHTVIVENQLEQTDHGHLGQLLTYAGGTDPTTVVWCSPSFREEHRAALDWLNENTIEGLRFFGVQIAVVTIDGSRPAPLFEVVAKPNDWTKQVKVDKAVSLSGKAIAYHEFWTRLLDRIRRERRDWVTNTKPPGTSWVTPPFGTSAMSYSLLFTMTGPRVELYLGDSDPEANLERLDAFREHRDRFDAAFGPGVTQFDELPARKACRIHVDRPEGGRILDPDVDEVMDWFMTTFDRFRSVTQDVRSTIGSRL